MKKTIRIVSRKSALALWQAEFVKSKLLEIYPELTITITGVTTQGDKLLDVPLHAVGGKGLFVKELEEYLLSQAADLAVHSLKDMPAELPEGLEISCILERADPRDALVSLKDQAIEQLPPQAKIGTSSLRRQAQLSRLFPDFNYLPLRGNVDTRLKKLNNQEYDAIILAVAGLTRLNCFSSITQIFEPDWILPAVGQGALGIETRVGDEELKQLIAPLHHWPTAMAVLAERSMNKILGGNCQLPVGALALWEGNAGQPLHQFQPHPDPDSQPNSKKILRLEGVVASPDGKQVLKATASMSAHALDPHLLGKIVAEQLFKLGADKIIFDVLKRG